MNRLSKKSTLIRRTTVSFHLWRVYCIIPDIISARDLIR